MVFEKTCMHLKACFQQYYARLLLKAVDVLHLVVVILLVTRPCLPCKFGEFCCALLAYANGAINFIESM